jgi:hypothetical protein
MKGCQRYGLNFRVHLLKCHENTLTLVDTDIRVVIFLEEIFKVRNEHSSRSKLNLMQDRNGWGPSTTRR